VAAVDTAVADTVALDIAAVVVDTLAGAVDMPAADHPVLLVAAAPPAEHRCKR
jgi:hypothetical protein